MSIPFPKTLQPQTLGTEQQLSRYFVLQAELLYVFSFTVRHSNIPYDAKPNVDVQFFFLMVLVFSFPLTCSNNTDDRFFNKYNHQSATLSSWCLMYTNKESCGPLEEVILHRHHHHMSCRTNSH